MLADKVMGDPAARVALIEYASLTCPHCASFHAGTLAQIKAAYIDTGKVKFVYRDFPLDEAALSAAMVARCSGDRYFTVLDMLFAGQGAWASSTNTTAALKAAVAPAGVSSATVDACLASADLRSGVLRIQTEGQSQYGVRATPTFIVGDQTIVGALPFADFDAILKRLTSG
jgi:protein-disulfide isomerase